MGHPRPNKQASTPHLLFGRQRSPRLGKAFVGCQVDAARLKHLRDTCLRDLAVMPQRVVGVPERQCRHLMTARGHGETLKAQM